MKLFQPRYDQRFTAPDLAAGRLAEARADGYRDGQAAVQQRILAVLEDVEALVHDDDSARAEAARAVRVLLYRAAFGTGGGT